MKKVYAVIESCRENNKGKSRYMFSTDAVSYPNAFNLLLVGVCRICEYM